MGEIQYFDDLIDQIDEKLNTMLDELYDKVNWVADKLTDEASSVLNHLSHLWPGESEIEKAIDKWNHEIEPLLERELAKIAGEVAKALGQLAGEPMTLIDYSSSMIAAKGVLYRQTALKQDITNLGNTWSGPAYTSYQTVAGDQSDAILALADALQAGGELTSTGAKRIMALWTDLYTEFYTFQSDAMNVIADLADAGKLLLAEAGPIVEAIALIWSKVNDVAVVLAKFFEDQVTDTAAGWQKLVAGSDGLPENKWPVIAETSSDTMNDPRNWPAKAS